MNAEVAMEALKNINLEKEFSVLESFPKGFRLKKSYRYGLNQLEDGNWLVYDFNHSDILSTIAATPFAAMDSFKEMLVETLLFMRRMDRYGLSIFRKNELIYLEGLFIAPL